MLLNKEEQEEFLREFGISQEAFRESRMTWEELDFIANDIEKKRNEHIETLREYESIIRQCPYVHSFSYRVKDARHLAEKVIRKNLKYLRQGETITSSNYQEKITDLLGIRILMLFKEDWVQVHEFLTGRFRGKFAEEPFVYIRSGDDRRFYEGKIRIKEEKPYRSAHYLVKTELGVTIEIQVRTLYEEAWGEIDHKIRYPYNMSNGMIENYINLMNRLTGMADEMGTFIHSYMKNFEYAKTHGIFDNNEVYQYILEKIEDCPDETLKQEITDKIVSASDFREMKKFADLFDKVMSDT